MRCEVGRIKVLEKKGTRSNCTLGVLEFGPGVHRGIWKMYTIRCQM